MFIPCFGHAEQMAFYVFDDGACRHTLNLASATWVPYSPAYDFINSRAVCIGPTTNNIAEYWEVIGLLIEAASQYVRNLVVLMDSQLVVCHLNHVYTIRNPLLLYLFRRVCLLERSFEAITYRHIPREDNAVSNSLENYILDWYIAHSWHGNQTWFTVNKLKRHINSCKYIHHLRHINTKVEVCMYIYIYINMFYKK